MPLGTVKGRMRLGLEKVACPDRRVDHPRGSPEGDMSDGPDMHRDEHADRWNDEVAAYALDALEGGELRRRSRLTSPTAPTCAERLRWLAPAVDVLPATVTPQRAAAGAQVEADGRGRARGGDDRGFRGTRPRHRRRVVVRAPLARRAHRASRVSPCGRPSPVWPSPRARRRRDRLRASTIPAAMGPPASPTRRAPTSPARMRPGRSRSMAMPAPSTSPTCPRPVAARSTRPGSRTRGRPAARSTPPRSSSSPTAASATWRSRTGSPTLAG